nr:MAG TPA: hypothetical protein [Caudoviricetes sp.]
MIILHLILESLKLSLYCWISTLISITIIHPAHNVHPYEIHKRIIPHTSSKTSIHHCHSSKIIVVSR